MTITAESAAKDPAGVSAAKKAKNIHTKERLPRTAEVNIVINQPES
jgi:hypothetical protein